MKPLTKIKTFLSNTSFGTIDQLRVEMETAFRGVQVTIETDDKKKLDCMFIPGIAQNSAQEGREEMELPTMIY